MNDYGYDDWGESIFVPMVSLKADDDGKLNRIFSKTSATFRLNSIYAEYEKYLGSIDITDKLNLLSEIARIRDYAIEEQFNLYKKGKISISTYRANIDTIADEIELIGSIYRQMERKIQ